MSESELRPAGFGWALRDGRPRGASSNAAALIWLGFIVFPLVNALGRHGPVLGRAVVIAGAVGFVAIYVWMVLAWRRHRETALMQGLFTILIFISIGLTLFDQPGWGFLFTYCAACTALAGSASLAFPSVLLCTGLAAGCSAVAGASGASAISYGASMLGVGLLMVLMRDLRMRNQQLTEARAELARTAVTQERERFARDLHDLLGHTLSVIALKAELAGRLLSERPEQAAREVGEVEQVARQALGEVRQAVSGYRRPTLDGELEGARMALAAAGIETEVQRAAVDLRPEVESVLAWAVREGATNVIRHSQARRCTLRISASLADAQVVVVDDGVGAVGGSGNGLAGLGERAQSLHGRVEAGVRPEGGFRLAVTVPVLTA